MGKILNKYIVIYCDEHPEGNSVGRSEREACGTRAVLGMTRGGGQRKVKLEKEAGSG